MEHFNGLTPAEAERLHCLAEECGEVVKAAMKILRHGYGSINPHGADLTNNRGDLEREMGDLRYSMIAMCEAGDVRKDHIHRHADIKRVEVQQWLHHQDD